MFEISALLYAGHDIYLDSESFLWGVVITVANH